MEVLRNLNLLFADNLQKFVYREKRAFIVYVYAMTFLLRANETDGLALQILTNNVSLVFIRTDEFLFLSV